MMMMMTQTRDHLTHLTHEAPTRPMGTGRVRVNPRVHPVQIYPQTCNSEVLIT